MELQAKYPGQRNIPKAVSAPNTTLELFLIIRSPNEINGLLSADLSLTMAALRQYPKVYWIWNHRRWCLEHVPDGPDQEQDGWRSANWAKELYVVEKMLDADARNCKTHICTIAGSASI